MCHFFTVYLFHILNKEGCEISISDHTLCSTLKINAALEKFVQ